MVYFVTGGLRGSLGLCFALVANSDEDFSPALKDIVNFI
jgi:hypothetical protein